MHLCSIVDYKHSTTLITANSWTNQLTLDTECLQIQPNKFPGDFQDTFNKFPVIFYIHRASLVLQLYVQWNGKLHYINAHTSMNSEMFSYEHVMMSSGC